MAIKLYDWAPSPFSLKVRAILDYKGLACERLTVLQPKHWLALRRRGRVGKVPALEIDGRLIVDSTTIAWELERLFPAASIIPADPRAQALCHAIEEWSDESLYFYGLYFQWHDPDGRRQVPQVFGRSLFGRIMYRYYLRRILSQLRGQGTSRKSPAHVLEDLARHLDALEDLVRDSSFVLGDRPYLCDFALLGQIVYLGRTPVGIRELAAHPAIGEYVARMKSLRADSPAREAPIAFPRRQSM